MASRELEIGDRRIADDTDAYIIAEVGHNHQGRLADAELLVRRAAESGAHAVKLQKRSNRDLYTQAMFDQPYTGRNSFGATYGEHREALEFGRSEYRHLAALAAELSVDFFATAFDPPSVDFLFDLGVPAIKIASGDLTNTPLLAYAAETGKPLVISTGGGTIDDVWRAMDVVLPSNSAVALLQCTAVYPAAPKDLNLSVITTFRQQFPTVVAGFSGHDAGPELSWIAYALGARVIEKHVTLDKTSRGSDHHFSLEPADLAELAAGLRRTRLALGSPAKRCNDEERAAIVKMGKKIVAARDLPAGHRLCHEDIAFRSPGDGLRPSEAGEVVGRVLLAPLRADDDITLAGLTTDDRGAGAAVATHGHGR